MQFHRKLIIPESVTDIGDYAFYLCSSLTGINIPDGVTGIGRAVFTGCKSLAEIDIPYGITSIGDYAFSGCASLENITYEGSMEKWGMIVKNTGWNDDTGD